MRSKSRCRQITEIIIFQCPFCNSEFHTNNTNTDKLNYTYTCGNCGLCFSITRNSKKIKSRDLIIWIEKNKVITWKPNRTPALGWNTLTLLEALADSANISLNIDNIFRCKTQLNKILKILRNKIAIAKRNYRPLLERCQFRETKRTRCNKTPIKGRKNGVLLCSYHYNKIEQQKTLIEFVEV